LKPKGRKNDVNSFFLLHLRLLQWSLWLRPRGADVPAVLVCPGRNADLDRVTGAQPPDHPGRDVAAELAAAGIASLTFDYGLLGAVDGELLRGRDETNLLALALGLTGRAPLALVVEDALRACAWLAAQDGLRHAGLFGHSLGAHVALHTALALPRPVPTVLASFLAPYPALFARDVNAGGAHALPGIYRFADLPDLVASLAPGALQLQIGEADASLPVEDATTAAEVVRSAYRDLGALDHLDVHVTPMGHSTDIAPMCAFFARSFDTLRDAAAASVRVPAAKIHFSLDARREVLDRVDAALSTGALTLGPVGERFEQLIGTWTSSAHAVAVNSGTAALEIALRTIDVADRTVLIPANTFFATALAALHAGARVQFVDIELDGLGMDPDQLRRELDRTPDAAAVVLVHIGGVVAPSVLDVLALCREREIPVIEDAAHALGSTLGGTFAGAFGDVAAFSMYPTKIVTSGEGGVLTTAAEERATHARLLRDQGKESFYANIHRHAGYNWRMSEVHASIGVAHLDRLAAFVAERRNQARLYDRLLDGCEGIRPFAVPAGAESNYYKYIALLDQGVERAAVQASLSQRGISLSGEVYRIPCSAQPYFNGRFPAADFPRAHEFCDRHICLPIFATLTSAQQHAVAGALQDAIAAQRRSVSAI
jgi:dTDP-4-amino-4,6-dideoxygalactose transaminase